MPGYLRPRIDSISRRSGPAFASPPSSEAPRTSTQFPVQDEHGHLDATSRALDFCSSLYLLPLALTVDLPSTGLTLISEKLIRDDGIS
jgi:hypothetical protein